MAAPLDSVISHWDGLHEGLQASVQDFYKSVEEALTRRAVPDIKVSRRIQGSGSALSQA